MPASPAPSRARAHADTDAGAVTTSHLTTDQLTRLAAVLHAERDEQAAKLAEAAAAAEAAPLEERDLAIVLATRARDALDDLDGALARLDDGTYGTCEPCGAAIPFERLEAIPHARHCVTCQGQAKRFA